MPNNRDDFSLPTRRKLAERAGYICSHPDCNAITVGASFEGVDKVASVGQAAHICAAAPGGKRYNPNMSSDERKNINNGIWLCYTHARMIDTDEETYTVELLHQWKEQAEREASIRLANTNFIKDFFSNNSIIDLENLFDNLIDKGDFAMMKILLNNCQMSYDALHTEFILRYQVIYDIYCNIESLNDDIDRYLLLEDITGINKIVELLVCFELKEALEKIKEFVSDPSLEKFVEVTINGKSVDLLNKSSLSIINQLYRLNNDLYLKMISFQIFKTHNILIKDEKGNDFEVKIKNDFLMDCLKYSYLLCKKFVTRNDRNIEGELSFIVDNSDKINELDEYYQKLIYENILVALSGFTDLFSRVYNVIPESMKDNPMIKSIIYSYKIINKMEINIDEVSSFCSSNEMYEPLINYLYNANTDVALAFLKEHEFLYGKNFVFISIRYSYSKDGIFEIINRYKDVYLDRFGMKCLEYLELGVDNLEWLNSNVDIITTPEVKLFISVLEKSKQYDNLFSLSEKLTPSIMGKELYNIAFILTEVKYDYNKIVSIYLRLEEIKYKPEGFYFNLGNIYCALGMFEKAKSSFMLEFDNTHFERALIALLDLRCRNNQCIDDKYLQEAKSSNSAIVVAFYAQTLEKMHNPEAYKYYLRSLLINDEENPNIKNRLFFSLMSVDHNVILEHICENSVCVLESENEKLTIAICEESIIEGITPNNFSNCTYCSKDSELASILLFHSVNDDVELFGNNYVLKEILTIEDFLYTISAQSIYEDAQTIKIHGESPEQAIENITEFLKESADQTENIIRYFNEAEIKLPLTMFAKSLGKKNLETLEFLLHGNEIQFLNNQFIYDDLPENIILSYDSVIILTKTELFDKLNDKTNLYCPSQIVGQLNQEISDGQADLESDKSFGSMVYKDGNVSIINYNSSAKRARFSFLNKIKNNLAKVNVISGLDYNCSIDGFNKLFGEERWLCESGALAAIQENKDYTLMSDDNFIYSLANQEGYKTVGICGVLSHLDLSCDEIIDM